MVMKYFLCVITLLCQIAIVGGFFVRRGRMEDERKRRLPIDGQSALDCSVPVETKGQFATRVGVSSGQIVELKRTGEDLWHGHVVEWSTARMEVRNALIKAGWCTSRGKLL